MPPSANSYQVDIKQTWINALNRAIQAKQQDYLPEAEMLEEYYGKDQKNIYTSQYATDIGLFPDRVVTGEGIDGNAPRAPRFRVRDNAAAKCVQIFVPMFLQGELACTVKANKPFTPPPQLFGIQGDPNQPQPVPPPGNQQAVMAYVQQEQARQQYFMAVQSSQDEYVARQYRASIMESFLNYSIKEIGLKEEARPPLRDCLVRGLGSMITEMVDLPNGSGKLVADTYLDDDRIVIDPNARRLKDAKWVAILCEDAVWKVAQDYAAYGITESMLRPSAVSTVGDATTKHHRAWDDCRKDVFRYWKIYSRCGLGARLKPEAERDEQLNKLDSILGDYCYIVVADGCDYPLNLTPTIEQMAMQSQGLAPFQVVTSWPVPFYYDKDDPWPFTSLWFHERKGSPWPKAHLSFALGYLNFMAWILGFVAEKAYRDSRGVWIVDSTVKKEVINWLESGQDEEILTVTKGVAGKPIKELIEFMQGPEFNGGLLELYQFMDKNFQDMTGMTDLLQGQFDRQMRSAQEAGVLQSASQLRPQDMAAKVQAWLGRIMRKHAIAARYLQEGKDLVAILGQFGAQAWDQGIRTQNMQDLFRESSFNVETGKGRPADINTDMENINAAMQFVFPALMSAYQGTGDPSSVNAFLQTWADARQMDSEALMLKPFAVAPPPGSPEHDAQKEQAKERADKKKDK
jgi:hypothetical protein